MKVARKRSNSATKKRLLNHPVVAWAIAILFSFVVRLIYLTNRVHKDYPEASQPYIRGQQPGIFCFWHGRMIVQPFIKPPRRMYVLMSGHRDGLLIGRVMRCFSIHHINGSNSRDASKALRGLLAVTAQGHNVSITPDGPRGPFQKVGAAGAAYLASKSNCPIIPVSFSATRHQRFRSWDKFMFPLPFGRIHFTLGEPIFLDEHADDAALDRASAALEIQLNQLTALADERCGVAA